MVFNQGLGRQSLEPAAMVTVEETCSMLISRESDIQHN
jgi:hypothetical protein